MTEETNNTNELGLNYSDEELITPEIKKNLLLTKIPNSDSPLIFKLIPDLRNAKPGKIPQYREIYEHAHIIGTDNNGKPIRRTHLCQKSLGSKKCPECDKYYEILNLLKTVGEQTADGKELKKLAEILRPTQRRWVNVLPINSDSIKAYKLPKDLINKLWGKEATKFRPAVQSILTEMKTMGMSPFNLQESTGWLSLSKDGEGLATQYTLEIAKIETPKLNAKGMVVGMESSFMESNVSESLLKNFNKDTDLLDTETLDKNNSFTYEESEEFAKNPRITPQRILDLVNEKTEKSMDSDENDGVDSVAISPEVVLADVTSVIDDQL